MSRVARVTIPTALAYRGGLPMLAWLLHRITGIGIVVFVSMHVLAAFFLYAVPGGTTNAVAGALTDFYESLGMQIFILFSIMFHAFNGLRIVVLDMFPRLWKYNREAMWVQWAIFLPMFLIPAALMIMGVQL